MSTARAGLRIVRTARRALEVAVRAHGRLGPAVRTQAHADAMREASDDLLHGLGVEIVVTGPVPREPALLVANHLGYLDPLLILREVPAIPLAKSEVGRWPIVGARARALGVIFVDRERVTGRARALLQATRALASGLSVLNFPEGTTTRGEVVLPFHRGLFGVAKALDAPIVPVRIDYDEAAHAWVGDETFVPHLVRLARHQKPRVHVRFGEPLRARSTESPRALAERVRTLVESMAYDLAHQARRSSHADPARPGSGGTRPARPAELQLPTT